MSDINITQKKTLKDIAKRGGSIDVIAANYDLRTIKALVRRDFAKLFEKKNGTFVKVTAKGKKAID
jgi:hypothetical protein